MFRYGILSTASIVERFIEGIRESEDGYVQAIASRTIEKAQIAAQRFYIEHYYGSYQELLEDENIDIVYIPTVNGFHYRDCLNALEHHKHVIVEKPMALTHQQALELFDKAKQNHCFLMEAQKSVFLPVTQKVKELLKQEIIGDIHFIEMQAGFPKRFDYDHWMYDLSMGGGALYGSATYTIEYLQYLFDHPSFDIDGVCLPSPTGSDEICHFTLQMNQSLLCASTIAMNVDLNNQAIIYGEKGKIIIDHYWKSRFFDLYLYDGVHQHFDYPCQSEFVYEINHIHHCLKHQLLQSPIMNQNKTLETISLVQQLYQKWDL